MLATRYAKSLWSYNPIPRGCVGYLPLWNHGLHGTVFKSVDSFGHVCTRTGGVMNEDGFTVDGNDYIILTNLISALSTADGTWFAWVRPDDATPDEYDRIISFGDTSALEFLDFYINQTDGLLVGYCYDATVQQWRLATDASPFSDATWASVGITHTGSTNTLYADGLAPAQTYADQTDKSKWLNDLTGVDNVYIGVQNNAGGGLSRFWDGRFGEVWFFDRALSATEMLYLHNQTKWRWI